MKIAHRYSEEAFVPFASIEDSYALFREKVLRLECSCNTEASIVQYREIHILSEDAQDLISRLYNMSVLDFMKLWYNKLDGAIDSMSFLYLQLQRC